MRFAIVDIETTGGHASGNGITEISILVHDGKQVIKQYETLINPQQSIPYYIRGLTGIDDAMVANAPLFSEVAEKIYETLQGCVFVAHSVNFDYSFVKHALQACGYELNLKKLCTVRLSRKIIPGLPSYSLGKICAYLDINITNRHRAGGDAEATVKLFEILMARDTEDVIGKFLKRGSKEQALPPNLPREHFEKLPNIPGVYYFHNQKGKIVYVGKAIDIKKRVSSHFSNNSPNKQKQDFMRSIHGITYDVCGNELMALILESHQIKHLWPEHNRSQKRFEPVYGIMEYDDQRGFRRLGLDKVRKNTKSIIAFSNLTDGFSLLRQAVDEFELCPRLAGIATDTTACEEKACPCISGKKAEVALHNKKTMKAIKAFANNDSFVIVEKGRSPSEIALVVVDKGVFKRMGYLPKKEFKKEKPDTKAIEALPLYRENFNIRQIISSYRNNYPENLIVL
jgi:DNA polymerase-3 subunit epsilon